MSDTGSAHSISGWHTRINGDIGKANVSFYILVPALQRVTCYRVDLLVVLLNNFCFLNLYNLLSSLHHIHTKTDLHPSDKIFYYKFMHISKNYIVYIQKQINTSNQCHNFGILNINKSHKKTSNT